MIPLNHDHVATLLGHYNPDLSSYEKKALADLSNGSPGMAIYYADHDALEMQSSLVDIFESWPSWNWVDIYTLSESVGRAGQPNSYKGFEDMMLWIIRAILQGKISTAYKLPEMLNNDKIMAIQQHYSLEWWVQIYDNLKGHFERIHYANLDKRQAVIGAFSMMK